MEETRAVNPGVVAEISVHRVINCAGFGWSLLTVDQALPRELVGGMALTATEAVWLAVDALRDAQPVIGDGHGGSVAVYSVDGESVATAPLYAVPQYELLRWRPIHNSAVPDAPIETTESAPW